MSDFLPYVLLGLNLFFMVIGSFAGFVVSGLREDVKSLRIADEKLADKLSECTKNEDFREFRKEQQEMFKQLFEKVDAIKDQVATKEDRRDHR